jgi:hypothetical protein
MNDIPSISSINIEDILNDLDDKDAKITISSEHYNDTITLNSSPYDDNTITAGGYSYNNTNITGTGFGGSNSAPWATTSLTGGPYTINGGTGISLNPWTTNTPKIKLDGEGADIEVNGWSLMDAIQKIEERLNILHPNEKLEAEWEELRSLGEQYRKLEQHIKDKQATWDKLKAMPPPAVD